MPDDLISATCCFTGHRDLPRYEEQKVLTRVRYLLNPLLDRGVRYFGVGGAMGFDMLAAEYLLNLRDNGGKKISIISVLPFPSWRNDWPEAEGPGVYLLRDRKLVDGSAYCISYCHRTTGGTAYTVRYAMKKGIPVYNASSWDLRQLG